MVAMVKVFFDFGFDNFPISPLCPPPKIENLCQNILSFQNIFTKSPPKKSPIPLGYYEYDACGWLVDKSYHHG